jgi:hypothetical protein
MSASSLRPDQQHWLPEQSLPVTPKVMAVAEITGAQHYARLVRRHGQRQHARLVEPGKPASRQ